MKTTHISVEGIQDCVTTDSISEENAEENTFIHRTYSGLSCMSVDTISSIQEYFTQVTPVYSFTPLDITHKMTKVSEICPQLCAPFSGKA